MTDAPRARPRASREIWLTPAYDLFVTDGIEAVKIMPLAKRLNLTRTGFYWHFRDLSELHDGIIDIWQSRNTGVILDRCAMPAQGLCAALFNLIDCWIDETLFDAPLDLAIRNWARNDARLQAVADRSDADRLTVILTQTGYFSMHVSEPRSRRARAGCQYAEIFAGEPPTPSEKDAFLRRHR